MELKGVKGSSVAKGKTKVQGKWQKKRGKSKRSKPSVSKNFVVFFGNSDEGGKVWGRGMGVGGRMGWHYPSLNHGGRRVGLCGLQMYHRKRSNNFSTVTKEGSRERKEVVKSHLSRREKEKLKFHNAAGKSKTLISR